MFRQYCYPSGQCSAHGLGCTDLRSDSQLTFVSYRSTYIAMLQGFLLFRVMKVGKDARFDDIRSHFFKFLGLDSIFQFVTRNLTFQSTGFWVGTYSAVSTL